MPKSAFLMPQSGQAERLSLTSFGNEDELRSLVEQIPELLDECLSEPVGRWLVVRREMGIPDATAAPDRWAVDLFLLDPRGMPTFVEVKRARDPRARREVIAQMLEYAANGASYLNVTAMRKALQDRADGSSDFRTNFNEVTDENSEGYWQSVEANLTAGHVRLVFVADRIPSELRRLVEFLNEKMPDLQVLALEVHQFKIGDRRVVIGEAIGNTMRSQDTKVRQRGTQPVPTDLGDLLERLEFSDPTLREKLETLFASVEIDATTLKLAPSQFTYGVQSTNGRIQIVGVSRKTIWLALDSLRRAPAFADDQVRRKLLQSLEGIMGRSSSTQNLSGYPSFDLALLSDDDRRTKFGGFLRGLVKDIVGNSTVHLTEPAPQELRAV
jgi:hypothetical protein